MSTKYATYPSLRNRKVLISGGAEGIGASLVEHFVLQGSIVVFLDISDTAAHALVSRLSIVPSTTPPIYYHCDLTNILSLQETARTILSTHGRIDILINNAARDTRMATAAVTPEFFDAQIASNLRHYFFLTQAIVPSMQQDPTLGGSIINIGSITWLMPATGLPCYTLSKAGIVGLTRTHAHEFGGSGIRVNSIMPGAVATPRQRRDVYTPEYEAWFMSQQALKRTLEPADVSRLALFLAADDSGGITSQSYSVDAGWT